MTRQSYPITMDSERFTDIFSQLHSKLRRVALRIVGDSDEAADAVQDVFCALWRRKDSLTDESSLEGLMSVSVRNRCVSEVRERSRHQIGRLDDNTECMADGVGEDSMDEESGSLFREVEMVMRESLSERDRQILLLRDHSGWEFEDLAEKFDMSPASVRMALSRARRTVRQAYRERKGEA